MLLVAIRQPCLLLQALAGRRGRAQPAPKSDRHRQKHARHRKLGVGGAIEWVLEPHRRPHEVPVPLPLQQYTVRHAVGAAFDRASITSRLARKVEEWSRAGALGEAQDGPDGVTAAGMHAALKTINALPLSPQMHEALWLTLADARATASHCYWLDLTTCPLLRRDGEQCSHEDTVAHAFWASSGAAGRSCGRTGTDSPREHLQASMLTWAPSWRPRSRTHWLSRN